MPPQATRDCLKKANKNIGLWKTFQIQITTGSYRPEKNITKMCDVSPGKALRTNLTQNRDAYGSK